MKAVILTANKNENFFPFSETRTKSMIPCSGNFLLGRLIQQLKTLSVTNICIVVGYQKNLIQGCFEYGQKFGVELHYEIQKGKGIGNALLSAEKYIAGEKFLLVYGDILTTNKHVLSFKPFLKENSAYSIASITHPFSKGSFGNVYLNHHMQITKITETPARTNQLSNYILSGMYLLQKDTFEILKEEKENIGALFQRLIKEGKFYANLSEEDWIDISYPWNIMDANRLVMKSWDHSIIPASTKIKVTVFRWAGSWGPFSVKIPCGECSLTKDVILDTFKEELKGIPVELELHDWLSEWWKPLKKGGWHAPIVMVEGKMISQGAALNRGVLTQAVIQAHTTHSEIRGNHVFGKETCPHCKRAKSYLKEASINYIYKDIVREPVAMYEIAMSSMGLDYSLC